MKKYLLAFLLVLFAAPAWATVLIDESFEDGPGQTTVSATIVSDSTAPSGTKSVMMTYPVGLVSGAGGQGSIYSSFPAHDEIWVRYWFKYSSNFQWNTIGNKLAYMRCGAVDYDSNHFSLARTQWGDGISYGTQHNTNSSLNQSFRNSNCTYNPTSCSSPWKPDKNIWYKVVMYLKVNTPGVNDGVAKIWVDDVLQVSASNVLHLISTDSGGWRYFAITPIWGGGSSDGNIVSQEMYMWFDDLTVQTTAFGEEGDTTSPYTDSHSPAKSSSGVLVTNRSISQRIKEAISGVVLSSINMIVEGIGYTCSVGLTCVGTAYDYLVTYTRDTDWDFSQEVNVTTTATDAEGNVMPADIWSFVTEAEEAIPLAIVNTYLDNGIQGSAYSGDNVTATGGTEPRVFTVSAGTFVPGWTLETNGSITGLATTAGTFTFTITVTDNVAGVDSQSYILTIQPLTPGGQVVWQGSSLVDTFTNSGTPNTNYSDNAYTREYVFPIYTPVNRSWHFDNTTLSNLPADIIITDARISRKLSYRGTAGTNPMRVHMYKVTGDIPDLATLTWNTDNATLTELDVQEIPMELSRYEWDITDYVIEARALDNVIRLASDSGADGVADTHSRWDSMEAADEANRPYLTITYTILTGPAGPSVSRPGKNRPSKLIGRVR